MNHSMHRAVVAIQPQYILVAQALIDDIQRGRYPVGGLLPREFDLCAHFSVSRHTVREAMRRLQERGLISRQRGVGTSVRSDRVEAHYEQSTASIADLPRYVEETRLVTHHSEDIIADKELAGLLTCPVGQRWVHVTGFRYAGRDKLPIALTNIYINAAYGGIQRLIGKLKVPVYSLIEREYGEAVVEVKQQIRAESLASADAKLLKVKAGSAGLVITRRYFGANGRVLEVAVNLHPADRFSYSMSLRMQRAASA